MKKLMFAAGFAALSLMACNKKENASALSKMVLQHQPKQLQPMLQLQQIQQMHKQVFLKLHSMKLYTILVS